jgi:hypothetical protein
MDQKELKNYLETASPEQRLALAKAGVIMAIMQEKLRMGFTNDEVATVLAMDDKNQIDEDMLDSWKRQLERFEEALSDEIRQG